jgi:cytochrome P450
MFDPEKFPAPDEFRGDRDVEYLHFGFGLHRCFGYAINGVVIPEILAALLRLPNLRRAAGSAGTIVFDGPFPERFILEFDGGSPGGGAVG